MKENLIKHLRECLQYCADQNGMAYCKNCGLDGDIIKQEFLTNITPKERNDILVEELKDILSLIDDLKRKVEEKIKIYSE